MACPADAQIPTMSVMKESIGRSGGAPEPARTQQLSVIAQVALAVVLLNGAGLLIKRFARLIT